MRKGHKNEGEGEETMEKPRRKDGKEWERRRDVSIDDNLHSLTAH